MRKIITVIVIGLLSVNLGYAQDKKIDKLEIFYDQGYYRKVLKKSRKLQAIPYYDYSSLPAFYESASLFRLAEDKYWRKRHRTAIDDAIAKYRDFMDDPKSEHYVNQHYYEIAELKYYLKNLRDRLLDEGWKGSSERVEDFVNIDLNAIDEGDLKNIQFADEPEVENNPPMQMTNRDKMVAYAKKYIGVKYKWAGSDDNGFDCSGYTSYIHKKFGILLPRTAGGQKDDSKKVKIANAQKGDLVFFGPGAKITHVGMVVSEKGKPLTMIHASSSKGVIITNIEDSKYWNPKVKGAGSYLL